MAAHGRPAAPLAAAPHELGLDRDLKERERELILATLRVTGGSRKLAAERLGISPRTLAPQAAAAQGGRGRGADGCTNTHSLAA